MSIPLITIVASTERNDIAVGQKTKKISTCWNDFLRQEVDRVQHDDHSNIDRFYANRIKIKD